ncbi:MAG: T9SS type A sorting domain-containing protein [Gelidibacter sp.]|nr:T9SS type A sorting domain-containing protein [Gelidibacter sp.]
MKHLYTTVISLFMTMMIQAQTYEFSIAYVGINTNTGNYQMALLATPSASVTNHSTDDMGAGFYVPAGVTLGNFVTGNSNLPASEWVSESLSNNVDAYFIYRVEAGANTILLNGPGPFELVLFDIIADPNPTTGQIIFVENGDPVFNELLFIENYINIAANNLYANNSPTANAINFATLSTQEFVDETAIAVYPNPASDIIHIKTTHAIGNIEMYDILGKQVLTTKNATQLDVSRLNSGVYLLKIKTDKGSLTKKIIIE